jgi:ubiquinone/menaquinone biosynthesis C-methylase UbiE/DNA-binding transcriptional ArsR family regulator
MTSTHVLDRVAVLADSLRARILAVLDGHELTVSELCDVLQLPQSTVSRHLKTLGDGGWVASRREGTSRYYSVPLDALDDIGRRLWTLVREPFASTAAAGQDTRRLKAVLAGRRSKSEQYFSSTAGQWDRVRDDLFGSASHLLPLLALVDPDLVAGDLGCGTGQVSVTLAPFVRRVIAVDASQEMLEAARARLAETTRVDLRRGALERLPIDDGELDAALLLLVLHHVADPASVLAEALRTLRPGGRLIIADMMPHEHEEYRQTMGHVWMGFGERQCARLASGAGFEGFHWQPLAVDPRAKGPALFVATAKKPLHDSQRPVESTTETAPGARTGGPIAHGGPHRTTLRGLSPTGSGRTRNTPRGTHAGTNKEQQP